MKNIMLMCNAGMSTSVLVRKMERIAEERELDVTIWAISETDFEKNWRKADVILLGPQVSYMKDKVTDVVEGNIPVTVIDVIDYGRMNGEKVLDVALGLLS
ncbi:PTS sugar transporter subunit IIB [Listeria ivanovii]|uniref:PTS sugar transporter subunit IIB n=2 Tax=Listeria ivanovii TaxID=1638 RepID=A0ABS1G4R7_LISIV|nr:PTS sugar transporter subunit IIB [Listeria ivanovii]EFR96755.1 lichenan-specific phosphotransferase enzyme IIB component [Listeria ivanovii FSL F6-596]AIS60019.1 PTS cellobiose transporter subunit IIB [Listeria ivanovii subsp. londoniensis]AIS62844.1 PTS cellobiose transporter subunit IIB [Listeria ivanovii subsp. londoniensis]MBC2256063.1 PTS sugar transporter subunit IIB [Listeria ivanovii]MBK1961864.1 PTS sugar transporter subunit IIB [Listeria ivanovii subsp. londoniensis]